VIEIYTASGIEHVHVRQVGNPTETRTLAASVLKDRSRFVPVM
jgi:hypothetical protein